MTHPIKLHNSILVGIFVIPTFRIVFHIFHFAPISVGVFILIYIWYIC